MGKRRAPVVVAAVVIGAAAAIAVWSYLGQAEERAFDGAQLRPVFVVKAPIRQGTAADLVIADGRIGTDRIPSKFLPPNALTNLETIRGKVTATGLLAGQILSVDYFAGAKASSVFAQKIPEGQVAISVQVDAVHGVANLVRPGDRVHILVVSPEGSKTLFQNVDVIAVGTDSSTAPSTGPRPATNAEENGLVTFAVPLAAAQKIALAASTPGGSLYLTLVPPDAPVVAVPPLNAGNLFQGALSPYT